MREKVQQVKSKLGKWFWVIIAVVVIGILILAFGRGNKKASVTTTVQKGEVKEELILTGQIKAEKYVALAFPAGGKIDWVGVSEGQKVKKGQGLTSVDRTVLNATYQQALNTYRSYQAAAESALDSVKDHSSDETFAQKSTRTTAEVLRDNAYDAVKASEYNLKNSILYAPFDGIVASIAYTSPGVNVLATQTQVEVVDPESIYFEVEADQSEVTNVKNGQKVEIVLDSYKDEVLEGEVLYVGATPKAGTSGIAYKVKVKLINTKVGGVLPRIGMTGDAKFVLNKKDDALFVPPKFINSDKDGKFVYLGKKNNKVRVEIGLEGEESTEIVKGVKEGDILYD